ncbi:uncharacterized protein [Haliotis cracherodii]|uniref:uncharacterized protein n=1 Tax=Haliotis cracherodii TaxID=6455 RepID=UPI0039ED0B4B
MMLGIVFLGVLGVSMADVMTRENKQIILGLHNEGREALNDNQVPNEPGAADIPDLTWNENLARKAKEHADTCQFKHSTSPKYGENLYIEKSSRSEAEVIRRGFIAWWEEVGTFRFNDKSCNPTQSCHYSQVVWEETRELGCALKNCHTIPQFRGFTDVWFLVCYYDPKGNWIGEEAYEPAK